MNITGVRKRLIPALLLAGTMAAGNAAASNQIKDTLQHEEKIEQTLTETTTENDNKGVKWLDLIGYLSAGFVVGTVGARAIYKMAERKKANAERYEYCGKKFEKNSDKLYSYMQDVLTDMIARNAYTIDKVKFYADISFFTKKYPSRSQYINLFTRAAEDRRLDNLQREHLAQYFIALATCSSKQESIDIKTLYPELIRLGSYEKMVAEVRKGDSPSSPKNIKNSDDEDTDVVFDTVHHELTFKDVGGQEEAIRILKRNILFPIKYPDAFKNSSISHGFLLYGPPGTGKTLISEALANESEANFIKLNGNELTSKWVGESEENWRKLFKEAMDKQPTIIFIDELDGIASKRGGGDVYNDKVVNQILGLLSDVEKNNSQVFIIATTNRKDMIDSAMLRPGRLGTHIELKPPQNTEEVKQILNIYLKKLPHYDKLNIDKISASMLELNVTGADIAYLVNEAYEAAMERNSIYEKMDNGTFKETEMKKVKIMPADIETAINKFKAGGRKRAAIGFSKK